MHDASPLSFADILALRDRAPRDRSGTLLVAGLRFVIRALDASMAVAAVVASPPLFTPLARRVLARCRATGAPVVELSVKDFRRLSDRPEVDGLGLVIRQPWYPLDQAAAARRGVWLCFEQVRSPGNLGAILRSAEAAGAAGAIFLGGSIDPWDPGAVRGSMGSIFGQRLVRASPGDLARWTHQHRCQVVGTSARAKRDYRALRYEPPTVFMIGCERGGLSPAQEKLCDTVVRIPMQGQADSLNVAVATSLVLYEAYRQSFPVRSRVEPS